MDAMKDLEKKANDHTPGLQDNGKGLLQGTLEGIQQGFIVLEDSNDSDGDIVIERKWTGSPTSLPPSIVDMLVESGLRSMMNTTSKTFSRSICLAYFDDVRAEEPVPGFAGKNSRTVSILKTKRASLR